MRLIGLDKLAKLSHVEKSIFGKVVCHFDSHPGNWVVPKDEADTCIMIDMEEATISHPGMDLSYMFTSQGAGTF